MAAISGPERARLEELILAGLCQGAFDSEVRALVMEVLASYQFQGDSHHVVYEALASVPSSNPQRLRELLPARANNLGFPDLDWDHFFAPRPFKDVDVAAQLGLLLKEESAA